MSFSISEVSSWAFLATFGAAITITTVNAGISSIQDFFILGCGMGLVIEGWGNWNAVETEALKRKENIGKKGSR